jgi:type I restriction enzyme M protein
MLSNPPYGVDWKKYQNPIKDEAATLGKEGRFGAGLPRISDGQLLFLQHMISKMRQDEAGSRIGIVMNGSPLFTGGAASGESEIRRWMLENDWVEAIVDLPTDLFYNTGIKTYVWLLTNRKPKARRGKVQLIDASSERFWKPTRKTLGSKRREIPEDARKEIVHIYARMLNGDGEYGEFSKIFDVADFGYREIRVERPLRLSFQVTPDSIARLKAEKAFLNLDRTEQDALIARLESKLTKKVYSDRSEFETALVKTLKGADTKIGPPIKKAILSAFSERDETADICRDSAGKPEPDTELRDFELVPLKEDWEGYVAREVTPFVSDAWVDQAYRDEKDGKVGRVGYEINFNRYFYKYVAPQPLDAINEELKHLEAEIAGLLTEVSG